MKKGSAAKGHSESTTQRCLRPFAHTWTAAPGPGTKQPSTPQPSPLCSPVPMCLWAHSPTALHCISPEGHSLTALPRRCRHPALSLPSPFLPRISYEMPT